MRLIRIFTTLSICMTKLAPKHIKEVVSKINNPRVTDSIMNPLFAFLFEASGGLHNIRFFSPGINTVIKDGRRNYVEDQAIQGDSTTDAAIKLFPSTAGTITLMTTGTLNFAKYFINDIKDGTKQDKLKVLADILVAVVEESGTKNQPTNINRRFKERLKLNKNLLSNENTIELYKNKTKDLKILLMNSFIINALDDVNDLQCYLEHLSSKLPADDSMKYDDEIKDMLNNSVNISNKLNFFPYSKINSPQSNIVIKGYDRTAVKPLEENTYEFPDCVDVAILHLCNCLFYDGVNQKFSLEHLPKKASSELFKFYETHGKDGIFTITEQIRDDWSKVVQDLPDEEAIENDKFNTHLISYNKHHIIDGHLVRNEIYSGFINMMAVLMRICGISTNEIFDELSDIETSSRKLMEILAVKPNEKSSIVVSFKNIEKFDVPNPDVKRKEDFGGIMNIKFNYSVENKNYEASVEIEHSSIHAFLKLDSIDSKIDDSVKYVGRSDMIGSLYNRYLTVVSNKSIKIEDDAFLDLFFTGKLDTNESKIECLKKSSKIVFHQESKTEPNISRELVNTGRSILESVELKDEGVLKMFRPFFFYKEDLLYKDKALHTEELVKCWTEASKLNDCEEIRNFWNRKMTEEEITSKIESLDISDKNIGKEGAITISKGLGKFINLKSLNIRCNSIHKEGAIAISEALKELSTLTKLNISKNKIGKEGVAELSKILEKLTNLESLDISENYIGKEGAAELSKIFQNLPKLTSLNISNNLIGDDGIVAFLKSLKELKNLTELDISLNWITKKGAKAISEALRELPNLKNLNISKDQIGKEGIVALSKAIRELSHLESLNVSKINVCYEDIKLILDSVKELKNFRTLDISHNKINQEEKEKLDELRKTMKLEILY